MTCEFSESAEFRDHIHNLLYEYSITHYTTNYIEFTEDLVGEFVENLTKIPLVDRYSLTRLPDPFDVFCQINSFSTLSPYDEIPQTTRDAILYLKNLMKSPLGVAQTEKVVFSDDYGPPCPEEPCMPALTRKARQSTPKPGKLNQSLPDTHTRLLTSQNIKALEIEPVEEKKLVLEDVLDIKCQIKPEELPAVQSLLRSTANMMRLQPEYKNRYLQPEYLANVPLPEPYQAEEIFLPIFAKDRLPRSGIKDPKLTPKWCIEGFKSLSETPAMALKKVDIADFEGSVPRQNLVVVDGWETIKSSPPSTPQSAQSDEDQVDQLFLPSSPDTDPPLITEFLQAKMEPVLMPRSRQIGGDSGIGPHILAGKSLGSFLQPLLSPIILESEKKKPREDSENQRCLSPVPSSMVGEADVENDFAHVPEVEQDLGAEIKAIYAGCSIENIIMQESIDDKPNMMMNVPDLPGPNVHPPNAMHVPKTIAEFLDPKRADNQKSVRKPSLPMHQFLSKAKGISPLYTSLSWVMFKTDKRLPSNEEAAGVDKLLGNKISSGYSDTDLAKIDALIEALDIRGEERLPRWDDVGPDCFQQGRVHADFQILQNREERWRLARLEGRLADVLEDEDAVESSAEEPAVDDDISDDGGRLESDRPAKRARMDDSPVADPGLVQPAAFSPRPLPPRVGGDLQSAAAADDAQVSDPRVESHLALDLDTGIKPSDNAVSPEPDFAPLEDDMRCNDSADGFDEDKENRPPSTPSLLRAADDVSSDYHTPEHMRHYLVAQQGTDDSLYASYPDSGQEAATVAEEGDFQLLSFGSKQLDSQFTADEWVPAEPVDAPPHEDGNAQGVDPEMHDPGEPSEDMAHTGTTRRRPDAGQDFRLLLEPSIASRSLGISAFAQLRARNVSSAPAVSAPQIELRPDLETEPTPRGATRADVVDHNTLQLPLTTTSSSSAAPPPAVHRYMASLGLIQKHALVRALSSAACAVALAERARLAGVDLVLDPHSAVVVLSLFTLSARGAACVARVAQESARYARLLVVFEAYPEQLGRRPGAPAAAAAAPALWAYTPPVVRAVKKFRRDLSIAEACGANAPHAKVAYAFADTVDEAARLIRLFGDRVEADDATQGALWGARAWLLAGSGEDDEARLAGIAGMNEFKAAVILCQVSLQEYVDMSAQERIDAFAAYVGMETMVSCNAFLDARLQEIYSESNVDEAGVAGNENTGINC